jgi:hypothetical protein
MGQNSNTLTIITNTNTAVQAAITSLSAAVASLPAEGGTVEAANCQAVLDAIEAPAAVLAEDVRVRTESAGQT